MATMIGALVNKPFSIPEADWSYAPAGTIANTADVVIAAAAGGECLKLCVSDRVHAVFRYVQASKRPVNIMAS
jgi:hypothetical protein